jgi:hypothetical protein
MGEPFLGSEAVGSGRLTPYTLRRDFVAVHRDVYIARHTQLTAATRAQAAWLWSRRRGVLAGISAAAWHGTKWIDARRPAEIRCDNRHPPKGIYTVADRFADDEVELIRGIKVTTPARTAFDIGCRYGVDKAVTMIDALANATNLKMADVGLLADRYPGRRNIRRARTAFDLVDPGAESPKETWLRLLVIRAGFPRPQTQIPVYDDWGQLVAVFDLGWEDIKVAADYDGDQHRADRRRFNHDIRRLEKVTELGWIDVRVTVEDTPAGIIGRIGAARGRRA